MDLTELSPLGIAALPLSAFRQQLRLGTGFADDATLDGELAGFLRAAMGAIEARTGKALIQRPFRLTLNAWRWSDTQALPIAPVTSIQSVTLVDSAGLETPVDPARYRFVPDRHRPRLSAAGAVLPVIETGGRARVDFTAGLAADWADVPGDLQQAVLLLAAQFHDQRTGAMAPLPGAITALTDPWRALSVGGRA